jgi:hypothetical protein
MTHSRYSFAKAPIGNLDQDSSEEEAVQDIIRRTLESLDMDGFDHDDSEDTGGYGTDDSWEVTRRRWARNKGDTVTVRRRRPVVNRGKALANLPGVPWPLGNQDDLDSQDDGDDDEEVSGIAAELTRQRTVNYFRSKVSQLSKEYSVTRPADAGSHTSVSPKLVSQVSPDSIMTFTFATRSQQIRKSATETTAVEDVTSTPSRSITQESRSPSSSSPPRRRRRHNRPVCNTNNGLHTLDVDSSLVQHVERARASVISSNSNTNTKALQYK